MVANRRLRAGVLGFAVAAVMGGMGRVGRADSFTFTGSTGNWSDPAQWLGGSVPVNDPTTQVVIQGPGTGAVVNARVDVALPVWEVNGLTVTLPSGASTGNQISIDPSSELQFVGAGAFLTQSSGKAITISGPVDLESNLTVVATGNGALTLNGPVTGSAGIIFKSSTNNAVDGNNTFQGGVTLAPTTSSPSVTLTLGRAASLGSGDLNLTLSASFTNAMVVLPVSQGVTTTISNNIVVTKVNNPSDFFGNIFENATIEVPAITANQTYVLQHLFSNGNTSISLGLVQGATVSPTWNISNLTINGTASFQSSLNLNFGTINETTPSVMTVNGIFTGTFNFNGTNSSTGGLQLSQGLYNANVADSLGKGPVTVFSGKLNLNATNAAQSMITSGGTVHYAANGAGGGNRITSSIIDVDGGVTSLSNGFATDILNSTSIIHGNGATLAFLDRGIGSGTVPNFDPAPGSMIDNSDPGLPTARNLGTNADLIASMHTIAPLTLAVGAGTSWKGIAANSGGFFGTLLGNSGFTLAGGTFGVGGAAGSFNIPTVGGTSKVPVTVYNTEFVSSLSDYSGVSAFFATGSFNLLTSNALGGGNGTLPVPLDVTGDLIVSNSTALNGNVTLHGGSTIELKSAGLNGTGTITRDSQPITVYIGQANSLSGTLLNVGFIHAGDTLRLAVNDVVGTQLMDPGANYVLESNEQAGGFNLNGGSLTLPSFGTLQQPVFASGNGTIAVGVLGATILSGGNSNIGVSILAQSTVNFGSPTGSGGYSIELLHTSVNQLNLVNVNNITLISDVPAALTGATITLNGGGLKLGQNFPLFPSPTAPIVYPNVINVAQSANISDNPIAISFPLVSIHLSTLNLASANLTLNIRGTGFLLDTLNLTGNGTLIANSALPITIGSVTQDGVAPRSLTLSQPSDGQTYSLIAYRIPGNVDSTGPITLTGSVEAEFDGVVSPSSAPLTISATGVLTGTGTIHRPIIFGKNNLNGIEQILQPGIPIDTGSFVTHSTAGTLTVDSLILSQNTFLSWNLGDSGVIGGPTNDLVAVLGNLTLDGHVSVATNFPIGTYTLFTYGGTLTDNGLTVPTTIVGKSIALDLSVPGEVNLVITTTPEPVSLGVMLPAVLMLGRRRRR